LELTELLYKNNMEKNKIKDTFIQKRPIFYTLSATTGFFFLLTIKEINPHFTIFAICALVIYSLVLTEVISTYKYASDKLKRLEIIHTTSEVIRTYFYYYLLITSILYVSTALFLYFQINTVISVLTICVFTATYYYILKHIRAVFDRNIEAELLSDTILDASIIAIFFISMSATLELSLRLSNNSQLTAVAGIFFSVLFLLLNTIKKQKVSVHSILYILIISLALGGIMYMTMNLQKDAAPITNSFLWTMFFYLLSAIYYHAIEGTLRFTIIIEYLVIAGVVFFLYLNVVQR